MMSNQKNHSKLEQKLWDLGINPFSDPKHILSSLEQRYDEGEKSELLTAALAELTMEIYPQGETSGCKTETTEDEPVNAFTYYGSNPRKNKDIYKKHKEWYRDYRDESSRKTNESLWKARQQSAMNVDKVQPKLGELDNISMKVAVHTLPVTDKGSILLLDSLENASQEINAWDGSLRQAIAYISLKEKKELTKEEILSYYEMCMGGNAKMAWDAMKETAAWTELQA